MSRVLLYIMALSNKWRYIYMQERANWQDAVALDRLQMINPLMDPEMDGAKRIQLRKEIAASHDISVRTVYRYEKAYQENSFAGLRPMNRQMRRSKRLPENWDEIIGEAIILKREVPKRSARQIIKILEIEGWAAPGPSRNPLSGAICLRRGLASNRCAATRKPGRHPRVGSAVRTAWNYFRQISSMVLISAQKKAS